MKKVSINVKDIAIMGVFVALIIVGGFIKIPTPIVPITLQVEVALLAGLLLGGVKGGACMLIYLVMGLIGIPVFTAGGGFQYVLYPTFGYIIGFVVGAFMLGASVNFLKKKGKLDGKLKLLWVFLLSVAALLVVYIFGVVYMYAIYNLHKGIAMGIFKAIKNGFLLFLPFDLIGCAVASIVYIKLEPIINKNKNIDKEKVLTETTISTENLEN